jgi:hypothetical protein
MPWRVRVVDPKAERTLLTSLLVENLSPDAGGRRFDWLYLENPHGLAKVCVAIEETTGRGLGAAAAFPRKLCVADSTQLGFVFGDFCIDRSQRALGLAVQLQKACFEQLGAAPVSLAYDFPSERMMAVYRRLRIPPAGQIVRWAKPLRTNRRLAALAKWSIAAELLAAPLNQLLKWKDSLALSSGEWKVATHRGLCGEEFSELAGSIGSRYGQCIQRSGAYLNWRYLQHPLARHEILTARRHGKLMGYLVFSHTNADAKIVDLFGFDDTSMLTALVASVVALLRSRGVVTVSVPVLATNPWTELFRKWGFRPREASPLVVYPSPANDDAHRPSAAPWFLMDGDRES